jgi:DNA-3-methyladenine glycosylase
VFPEILSADFYNRPALEVARSLLGMRLVREVDGARLSGVILEAEAYQGEEDLACHARAGRTPRTRIMYGPPGHAYIYFTYGMHWMLNCVTGEEGFPAAVLIRSLRVVEGYALVEQRRRQAPAAQWTDGPAKLCQAFAIDGQLNGVDLCRPGGLLWIERGELFEDRLVKTGPRVGIPNVPEPWRSIPWRFWVEKKDQGVV